MARPYNGESRDEWEGVVSPDDELERARRRPIFAGPYVDEDEAYERMLDRQEDNDGGE